MVGMVKFFSETDVRRLLPMDAAIRLLRDAFEALGRGSAQNQARRRLALPGGSMLHALAGVYNGYFGTKIYATHPRHGAHFLVLLYDAATAAPLAVFEANHLGQIRTGAASGLATDLLASRDASVAAIIGSGFQARSQLEAVAAVRKLTRVRVWSRSAEKRARFAAEMSGLLGLPVEAAGSAESAVRGAGIIVTATYAKDPVLEDEWVPENSHVNAVGSNNPDRRELPAELIGRAGLIAVDSLEQARIEAGDLIQALGDAEWDSDRVVGLQRLLTGECAARPGPTVFKSVGLGVEDTAAAGYIYRKAMEEGWLKELPLYS